MTTTGTMGGRYTRTMKMVAAGGDAAEMQGGEGWQNSAKGDRDDGVKAI